MQQIVCMVVVMVLTIPDLAGSMLWGSQVTDNGSIWMRCA
jgi:hypothetical protein